MEYLLSFFFFFFLVCRHITVSVSLGMKTVHGKDEPKVTPTNRWAQPARLPWRGHLPLLLTGLAASGKVIEWSTLPRLSYMIPYQ